MTVFYDVFNGDADGICALHQLRLSEPRASVLITGVKRDIALLERVKADAGDEVTVCDISLARNSAALHQLLTRGATCLYFDHHFAGEVPLHPNLKTHIDTSPGTCTSLIVDRYLEGSHKAWAVVAAFGDNLPEAARAAAVSLKLNELQLLQLMELGECINYNAYGERIDDLHYEPADLYETLARYRDPFQFMTGEPVFDILRAGRADDLYRASEIAPVIETSAYSVYVLPDAAWTRRVNGEFANRLANMEPARAHAVLTRRSGGYAVSVRAPRAQPYGADQLCRQFPDSGGRQGAAGINFLQEADYDRFIGALKAAYGSAK
jgi:single-stranded DNA-specific DHH superfamily exonuclease